jgi:SEL1 protein
MWNMGWMYENGVGVPQVSVLRILVLGRTLIWMYKIQDFHLAKRFYDHALATNSEAYLPVSLSLVKLYARSMWHTLSGGKDGLSLWPFGDEEGQSSFSVTDD